MGGLILMFESIEPKEEESEEQGLQAKKNDRSLVVVFLILPIMISRLLGIRLNL
jgi:hypothetical protein